MDSITPEIFEQTPTLINTIKTAISDYAWEHIFREFLQNADDAGARKYSVIIDERCHQSATGDFKTMAPWQGPALLIYNDAKFKQRDFEGLQKLGEGGKRDDETRIGRFGIGFNTCYNVTDVPSVASGGYIAFFDPHKDFLPPVGSGRRAGVRYKFADFCNDYPAQAAPYLNIKNCTRDEFKGTLFRLPLRSDELAKKSKIKQRRITPEDLRKSLGNMKKDAQKYLLFLRNVEEFEVLTIDADVTDDTPSPKLMWRASIVNMDESIRRMRSCTKNGHRQYPLSIVVTSGNPREKSATANYHCSIRCLELCQSKLMNYNRRISSGGIAVRLDRNEDGNFFCYFPLPTKTGLSVHIHGLWETSSDRMNILLTNNNQSDMDGTKLSWNRHILWDVLPKAHVELLKALSNRKEFRASDDKCPIKECWPLLPNDELFKKYGENVLRELPLDYPFFKSNGKLVSIKNSIFCSHATVTKALDHYGDHAVCLTDEKINSLKEIGKLGQQHLITAKGARDKLRNKQLASFLDESECCDLLLFLVKEGGYTDLSGLQLLPLKDGTMTEFGSSTDVMHYYVASEEDLEFFPNFDEFRLVDTADKLYKNVIRDRMDAFQSETNLRQFDGNAIYLYLQRHLPRSVVINEWNPDEGAPGETWLTKSCLDRIWELLIESSINVSMFKDYPILDIPGHSCLVPLERQIPVLVSHSADSNLSNALSKLDVLFTDRSAYANNSEVSQYIYKWSPMNVLAILQKVWSAQNRPKDFLRHWCPTEVDALKAFIRRHWSEIWKPKKTEYVTILKNLRIWPIRTQSSKKVYVTPSEGSILEKNVFQYSSPRYPKIFATEDQRDHNILRTLGASSISAYDYLVRGGIIENALDTDIEEYVRFLESILRLNDDSILEYLRSRKMIPNQEGSMVKPSNLYHAGVELFRVVFGNAPDKLLSASFKGNSASIQNLQKIGVNTSVDAKNFLKCAEYIAEQVKWTTELENDSTINLRVPALVVLNYLYNNFSSLSFNDEQWARLELIEFVPVVPVTINGQRHKCCPMPLSGFGALKNICLPEYRDISWTQLPIIDYNVIPRGNITRKYPHIGAPTPENVIKHLKQISMKLNELVDRKDVYRIVKMIYEILDRTARNSDSTIGRWLKKAGTIFLNINEGEDPFDRKNWKAYSQLKFGATKQENDFIKEILQPYPELLKAAGVKNVRLECLPEPEDKQTNRFLTGILNLLSESPDVHDTVFDVKGEKFYANKYVLAANGGMFKKFLSSTHFKGSTPSDPAVHEISEMDPRSFEVFLSYLYGNMLNVSISSKWNVVEEESERVQLYLDLLWAANFYELIDLRDIVECRLSRYLTRTNVKIIKEYADKYEGKQLAKVCANYMKTNCQD